MQPCRRDTLKDDHEVQKKAECLESIQALQAELVMLRASRKDTPKKVTIESLPTEQRPTELLPLSKQLADTVKSVPPARLHDLMANFA